MRPPQVLALKAGRPIHSQEQEDAQEFLGWLLDSCHEELAALASKKAAAADGAQGGQRQRLALGSVQLLATGATFSSGQQQSALGCQ